MTLHGVECERLTPPIPEQYSCRWQDRNKLALGLLGEGKGTKIKAHDAIPGNPGIIGKQFAVITILTEATNQASP